MIDSSGPKSVAVLLLSVAAAVASLLIRADADALRAQSAADRDARALRLSVQETAQSASAGTPTLHGMSWPDPAPAGLWLPVTLKQVVPDLSAARAVRLSDAVLLAVLVVLTAACGTRLSGLRAGLLSGAVSAAVVIAAAQSGLSGLTALPAAVGGALLLRVCDHAASIGKGLSPVGRWQGVTIGPAAVPPLRVVLFFGILTLLPLWIGVVGTAVLLPALMVWALRLPPGYSRRWLMWRPGWLAVGLSLWLTATRFGIEESGATAVWLAQLRAGSALAASPLWAASELLALLGPLTPLIVIGLAATRHDALGRPGSRQLLVRLQAVLIPLLVVLLQPGRPEAALAAVCAWSLAAVSGAVAVLQWVERWRVGRCAYRRPPAPLRSSVLQLLSAGGLVGCAVLGTLWTADGLARPMAEQRAARRIPAVIPRDSDSRQTVPRVATLPRDRVSGRSAVLQIDEASGRPTVVSPPEPSASGSTAGFDRRRSTGRPRIADADDRWGAGPRSARRADSRIR